MNMHTDKTPFKRRVFLDIDSLAQWDIGIFQRFPPPEKVPLSGLEAGPPGSWDAVLTSYPQVLKEDGRFRMWYMGMREADNMNEMADRPLVCYAESDDGVHWRKPDLKITGQKRWPGNNLLKLPGCMMGVTRTLPGADSKYLAVTILYPAPLEWDVCDAPGNPDPLKGGSGTHIWASDDGFHWRHVTDSIRHGDWACLHADRVKNRYLLHNKIGMLQGMTMRRAAIGVESRDGKQWEGYDGIRQWRESFACDDADDLIAQQRGAFHAETYTAAITRVGEILVSAEAILNVWPPLRTIFGQNPNGIMHIRLGFSHDGFHWRYPKGRPAWIDPCAPGGLDAGIFVCTCPFVEHGDDLLFYYGGGRYSHGWSINPDFSLRTDIDRADERASEHVMMARIKRDRFASLACAYKGWFDVDAPYRLGDELFVNVLAPQGQVRVAIAEKAGDYHAALSKHESLPGFSFADCVPITGDQVRAPLRFKKARLTDIPADKPINLRFELTRAEVFGYEWR